MRTLSQIDQSSLERFFGQGKSVLSRCDPARVLHMNAPGACGAEGVWLSAGGRGFGFGEVRERFTLMSAVKPFLLLRLFELHGAEKLMEWVGDEPSDLSYYSLEQLRADGGKPRNAMINSGAMLLAAKLPGRGPLEQERLFAGWLSEFAPAVELVIDGECLEEVMEGDSSNRALARELERGGMVESADDAFEIYFRLCCLAGTIRDVAELGKSLALSSPVHRDRVLRTMARCGLYEASGTWFAATGLPAKSGVSGVMFGVWPDQGCLAACSPWLDAGGNPIFPQAVLAEAAVFSNMSKKFKILFVCLGNICRSPAAEGVMRRVVERAGLEDRVEVDSAGTAGWHEGKLPDARMRQHAARRGYELTSRARQVRRADFEQFDLIVVMDRQNRQDLAGFFKKGPGMDHVRLFCDFVSGRPETEVPDPYYGGADGFETVLDLVENGCEGILREIKSR